MKRATYGSRKYLHGLCHTFALALHQLFGYQLAYLEDLDRSLINDRSMDIYPYIPHVFCVKNGYIIDARGVRNAGTMIRESGKFPIKNGQIHTTDVRFLINSRHFKEEYAPVKQSDLVEAKEFILKHRRKYQVPSPKRRLPFVATGTR